MSIIQKSLVGGRIYRMRVDGKVYGYAPTFTECDTEVPICIILVLAKTADADLCFDNFGRQKFKKSDCCYLAF
jgi:hypothetical protein